jgi:hypothetical protein
VNAADLVTPEVRAIIDERGGTWAVYQNQALGSATAGHVQCLR